MSQSVTPRSVLLNLVRVAQPLPLPIRELLRIGSLFGFTGNAMRVAATRLTAEGRLTSDERGTYRLGPSASVLSRHVEDWRRGETRMRPWKGEWLAVLLPPAQPRVTRRASLAALPRIGFREWSAGLWLRPDNLKQAIEVTTERLRELGLEETAEVFRARDFSGPTERIAGLWPTSALERGYQRALQNLSRSMERLGRMAHDAALLETFVLGGEAIRILATDPLLPEQIMKGETRARLTEAMVRYDAIGHDLWRGTAAKHQLSVIEGGRRAS